MIDFNDTTQTAEHSRESDRDELRVELLERLESVLTTMFPAGKKRKGKFLIGDVLGSPGDSLEVVLEGEKAGLWTDRATGDGGDIFALIASGPTFTLTFPACSTRLPICSVVRVLCQCAKPRRKPRSTNLAQLRPSGITTMPAAS